jgi:hypothetical protein
LKQGANLCGAPGGNSCALGSQISTSFRQKAAQEAERLRYELPSCETQKTSDGARESSKSRWQNFDKWREWDLVLHVTPSPLPPQAPFVIREVGTVTIYRAAKSEIQFFHLQIGSKL